MEINDKKISVNKGNEAELNIIREIAESGDDCPVLMLNLNKYNDEAGFPNGSPYKDYINVLETFFLVLVAGLFGEVIWTSGRRAGHRRDSCSLVPVASSFLICRTSWC